MQKPPRLPGWTRIVVVVGGCVTYWAVGELLLGIRFAGDLDILLRDPGMASADPEMIARFVLLLIPAVLGALWTRENLRIVFRGLRRGDAPGAIARELALYALGVIVLVIVGLTSSARRRY